MIIRAYPARTVPCRKTWCFCNACAWKLYEKEINSFNSFVRQRLLVQLWFTFSMRLLLMLGIYRDITRRSLRVHEQRWSSTPEASGTLYQDLSIDNRRASIDGVSQTARTGGNCLSLTRGLTSFLCSHVIRAHICTDMYSFATNVC